MSLLSFDIGIKNLAYCVLCEKTQKIQDWGIINISCENQCQHKTNKGDRCEKSATKTNGTLELCTGHSKLKQYSSFTFKKMKSKNNLHSVGKKMVKAFDEKKIFQSCHTILVENQPSLKNPTMKSIQMMVYTYFLIKNKPDTLEMINARNKLKVYHGPPISTPYDKKKDTYKKNKYLAVLYCESMIQNEMSFFQNLYKTSKKKDDLSDCYLQAIYYLEK